MAIATTNPTTGKVERTFDETSDAEVERILALAASTFRTYRTTTFDERGAWMVRAAEILEAEVDRIAAMMTTEMGKTLAAAKAEVLKCAIGLPLHGRARRVLPRRRARRRGGGRCGGRLRHLAAPRPGAGRDAVELPALAGHAVRRPGPHGRQRRPAEARLQRAAVRPVHAGAVRAGRVPRGRVQTLLISSPRVEGVLRDDRVVAVTLTGSGPAGSSVASVAGDVIKHSVLELGGSDPFVVMPSADLSRAAKVACTARTLNNGQSCIAAKRFIAHAEVADKFERLFVDEMSALAVGDPMDEKTAVGPLASAQQQKDMAELVADAVGKGATVLCGGTVPDGPGFFYPPTVLTDITPEMRIHTEEAFGPVATLYRVADIDEAIELANVTEFGLGSNVWTEDADERARFVRDIEAGMLFINGNTTSFSQLPFGGVKSSGYGRELTAHGIREFCNLKSVWVGA